VTGVATLGVNIVVPPNGIAGGVGGLRRLAWKRLGEFVSNSYCLHTLLSRDADSLGDDLSGTAAINFSALLDLLTLLAGELTDRLLALDGGRDTFVGAISASLFRRVLDRSRGGGTGPSDLIGNSGSTGEVFDCRDERRDVTSVCNWTRIR